MNVFVVGAGIMGGATANALAQRGHQVTLWEQFTVGHTRGSSHGRSRIFRLSYPDAVHVGMAQESLGLWRRLEADNGTEIVTTTGGLDTGKRLDDHVAALETHGVDYELMSAAEIRARWPFLALPDDQTALFQPDAGIIAADRALKTFVDAARSRGAEVREGSRVVGLRTRQDGVEVQADDTTVDCDVLVVTAGGWAPKLLATDGIDLPVRPTRETVAYFRMEESPPTLVDWGDPSVYALPSPGQGIKVGEHIAGPTTDPDDEGEVNASSIERLRSWVAERYPTAEARPHHAETCIYTNTADEHFILERHERVVVGSPCSGHGFKFAPLIGERLADLATS